MFRVSKTLFGAPSSFFLLTISRRFFCCSSSFCGSLVCFMSYLVLFCSCVFQSFSIAITSLGEERANLSAFRTFVRFVRFVLVWVCRFPLPVGVWEGLRFVIVALPGLFSYLLFIYGIYFIIFFSSLLLLVPREGCAS